MERTLDVAGLAEDRVQYLKNLIALWKERDSALQEADTEDVQPSDFAVRPSDVKGGRVTRAMAYE